jgi:hypothetical protein
MNCSQGDEGAAMSVEGDQFEERQATQHPIKTDPSSTLEQALENIDRKTSDTQQAITKNLSNSHPALHELWCAVLGLNQRPLPCQGSALPLS